MAPHLQIELKQNKPFPSVEQEALVSIARTAAVFDHAFAEALRPHEITPTQYNVLRILRGAGPDGLCRNEVRDRLITRVPDVTRLLDRMSDMGLVSRDRDTPDRRFVTARITAEGLTLLTKLEVPVSRVQRILVGHLNVKQLSALVDLLALARRSGGRAE